MGQRSSDEHRDLRALAPELSQSLLAWWEVHGRRDPAQKPWMFTAEGRYPEPGEPLDVGGIWIASEMSPPPSKADADLILYSGCTTSRGSGIDACSTMKVSDIATRCRQH